MSDVTLDELLARQKAMSELAASLERETDVARIQAVAAQLSSEAESLGVLARAIEAAQSARAPRGYTEVVLTAAQRERIKAQTGVDLEQVRIADEAGIATRVMPRTDPRLVEHQALREAERIRVAREAEATLAAAMQEAFAAIESQNNPVLTEQLHKMQADPAFFGGLPKSKR